MQVVLFSHSLTDSSPVPMVRELLIKCVVLCALFGYCSYYIMQTCNVKYTNIHLISNQCLCCWPSMIQIN